MRYHIDTVPVWDSLKIDGECFLCALRRRIELGEVERYLGASVMEPDVRIQVNERGFCCHHQTMLYGMTNRLGHALMLQTHLEESRKRVQKPYEAIRKAAKAYAEASLAEKLSGKAAAAKKEIIGQAEKLTEMAGTCVLCDSINENMERYLHTFFHMYHSDGEFRRRFAESKGLCMADAALLMRFAPNELNGKETQAFIDTLADMQEKNLSRMQDDIDWFIRKFDYRFDGEPWKNSRDAVERTVNKLRGWCVGQEPNPKE